LYESFIRGYKSKVDVCSKRFSEGEYGTLMVNFTKSSNQESSFTKAAIVSFKYGENSSVTTNLILNDDGLDDPEDD
jgi:hypothetical protein